MNQDDSSREVGANRWLGPALEEAAYDCMSELSGVNTYDVNLRDHPDAWAAVEAFAAKVQAAERERCATYCDGEGLYQTARAIRAGEHAGPVERGARPLRWLCRSCDWTGGDAELLRAPSPFDATDTIVGCPKCKAVEDIANACDEPGCGQEATCGFPAPGGYRRTCGKHANGFYDAGGG